MRRVRLIHFNAERAQQRADKLRAAGYAVVAEPMSGPADLKKLRRDPPDAVVIDLSRRPSGGRDIAVALRACASTRRVALVFVDGQPAWEERISELLPDAAFTRWSKIRGSVRRAIEHPPADPVKPSSAMAGYAGTPLPKKLGIKPNMTVAILGAPADFGATLGSLPQGVTTKKQARGQCDLIVYFVTSRRNLKRRIQRLAAVAGTGGLWVVWPKKSSGKTSDLSQPAVRELGLAVGLVDYKVSAIDAVWSGLRFTRRAK